MTKLFKIIAALSPLALLKASLAYAAPSVVTGLAGSTSTLDTVGAETGLTATDLPTLIGNLINVVLGLLGIVFVVLIIYGGVLWMTAAGGTEQIKKAKAILINSIVGLVITVAAYAISAYVISAIVAAAG